MIVGLWRIRALWHLFPCEAKFIMPVRNPADRALSWFNDKVSSHQINPETAPSFTRRIASGLGAFRIATILEDALSCGIDPSAILIVDTDNLKSVETIKTTMDAINEHLGLPPMTHEPQIFNDAKGGSDRHLTATLSIEDRTAILTESRPEIEKFLGRLEHPERVLRTSR